MNNCVHKLVCDGTKALVACEGQRIISMLFLGCDPSCSPDTLLLARNSPTRLGGRARESQGLFLSTVIIGTRHYAHLFYLILYFLMGTENEAFGSFWLQGKHIMG